MEDRKNYDHQYRSDELEAVGRNLYRSQPLYPNFSSGNCHEARSSSKNPRVTMTSYPDMNSSVLDDGIRVYAIDTPNLDSGTPSRMEGTSSPPTKPVQRYGSQTAASGYNSPKIVLHPPKKTGWSCSQFTSCDSESQKLDRWQGYSTTSPQAFHCSDSQLPKRDRDADPSEILPEASDSDESDVNLLRYRGRANRVSNQGFSAFERSQNETFNTASQPLPYSTQDNNWFGGTVRGKSSEGSGQDSNVLYREEVTRYDGSFLKKTPDKADTEVPNFPHAPPPEEMLTELRRLQGKIVTQAHLNRFKDLSYTTSNPEVLAKCREGPGTDRNSDVYKELARIRLTPHEGAGSHLQSECSEYTEEQERPQSFEAQLELYQKSVAVYPLIVDGKLFTVSRPTSAHQYVLARIKRQSLVKESSNRCTSTGVAEKNWADEFLADWDYRPRVCPNFDTFRESFQRWLDETIDLAYEANIYHKAFFDGTAHPDGQGTLFIPGLESDKTFLDSTDEETCLHVHETAAGYCYNLDLHNKREEQEQFNRRKIARDNYLQAMQSPAGPSLTNLKANISLRPVEMDDIPELIGIFNWYARRSNISAHTGDLDSEEVRRQIQDCKDANLPYIVAVDRQNPEGVMGYAFASNFEGAIAAGRFTAQLEVFVKAGYTRQGIGKCLMDKLLEVCDPSYVPKSGYGFMASQEQRSGYYAGGRRRLARLIFTLPYLVDDSSEYEWTKDWLEKVYFFEEQGILRGSRVKFGQLLNVSYLVRNVGFTNGNRWT